MSHMPGNVVFTSLAIPPPPPTPQYVFKVPHADTQVMVSLLQKDPRENTSLGSIGGNNFAVGFYIMKASVHVGCAVLLCLVCF